MTRQEIKLKLLNNNGVSLNLVLRDGIVIDDLLVQGMKAEGYRVVTGKDVFPTFDRRMKDFLIRLNVIPE